jgi:hypothetical protein
MALTGGCSCGAIRYELTNSPLIVHACHCRDCQRVTGGPHVINLWIESRFVEASGERPKAYLLKGGSGKRHEVFFCETCGTYVWSRYSIVPTDCLFVRAGTLDNPTAVTPDVHIFTRTKLPWVQLPKNAPVFEAGYDIAKVWPAASLERMHRNVAAPT